MLKQSYSMSGRLLPSLTLLAVVASLAVGYALNAQATGSGTSSGQSSSDRQSIKDSAKNSGNWNKTPR
jgi:hypothetical protein